MQEEDARLAQAQGAVADLNKRIAAARENLDLRLTRARDLQAEISSSQSLRRNATSAMLRLDELVCFLLIRSRVTLTLQLYKMS